MQINSINLISAKRIQNQKVSKKALNTGFGVALQRAPGIEWHPDSIFLSHDGDTQGKIESAYEEMKEEFKILENNGMKIQIGTYMSKKSGKFPKGTLLLRTTTLDDKMITEWDNFNWGHWVVDPNRTTKDELKKIFSTIIDNALEFKARGQVSSDSETREYNPHKSEPCLSCS